MCPSCGAMISVRSKQCPICAEPDMPKLIAERRKNGALCEVVVVALVAWAEVAIGALARA